MKTKKHGFSLLEILVVIAILGFLTITITPLLRRTSYDRDQFVTQLNQLTQLGWQEALMTGKIHRLLFDTTKRTVIVEVATEKKDQKGFPIFASLKQQMVSTSYRWPANIEIKQFILQGKDELKAIGGKGTIWFAIIPEGLTQEVIINVIDTKDKLHGKSRPIGLVLNPFSAQFKEYDAFQK